MVYIFSKGLQLSWPWSFPIVLVGKMYPNCSGNQARSFCCLFIKHHISFVPERCSALYVFLCLLDKFLFPVLVRCSEGFQQTQVFSVHPFIQINLILPLAARDSLLVMRPVQSVSQGSTFRRTPNLVKRFAVAIFKFLIVLNKRFCIFIFHWALQIT